MWRYAHFIAIVKAKQNDEENLELELYHFIG